MDTNEKKSERREISEQVNKQECARKKKKTPTTRRSRKTKNTELSEMNYKLYAVYNNP